MGSATIIGAGLSGLTAAIALAEHEHTVYLVSLQDSERAQSNLAEGGINAALNVSGENDSPAEHFAETMRGGADLADPAAVRDLVTAAPGIVRKLQSLGAPFSMRGQEILQRKFGGQKKRRTAYCQSSTGKALMTAMIDEARKYEGTRIHRYPHHSFVRLELADGRCTGVLARDEYSGELLRFPAPVILCCGGPHGLFPGETTGTTANDGSILAGIFSQGVEAANLEMIQYHPTTVRIAGKRLLISEAARGEGGRLYVERDGARWYFLEEKYPELGNLMPRDVVSREMTAVLREPGCGDQVYLDLTGLSREVWRKTLPDMREEILHYLKIDPAKQPVPVEPGIHFFMGGIAVDRQHRTNVNGLYAAGECASQYHGANRLGGNSLLGAIYGGRRAAETAMAETDRAAEEPATVTKAAGIAAADLAAGESPASEREREILSRAMGIERTENELYEAEMEIRGMRAGLAETGENPENCAAARRLLLEEAMLRSARERRESRGAHLRTDFPERDDWRFRSSAISIWQNGELSVSFRPVSEGGRE